MSHFRARRLLERLYRAALAGVDPEEAVVRALAAPDVRRACRKAARIGIFAVGKAAAGMTRGAMAELEPIASLIVVPRDDPAAGLPRRDVLFAAHPEPDASSVRAARRALRFFGGFGSDDVILCLVSGGASSLLALPRAGITLSEKRRAIRKLSRAGASIVALNRLRTSLSSVKGGRLGRATRARLVTLILSDVPGDRARLVGSGPTVRAREGDVIRIVGSNATGLDAAAREGRRLGLRVVRRKERLSGPARRVGRSLARQAKRVGVGTLLLAGGETVVTLGRVHGRGGRSLELALSAGIYLEGSSGVAILAAGSDGRDGSSTAAGAFADVGTVIRARARRLDPEAALRHHDTHAFFERLGDLFVTGPTGTNVGDWVFAIRGEPEG